MRRAYQLTALALRSLAGALPATTGLVIGAGAGYLLWPHLLPEASAGVVLPFAVFGAVAGWLAFRIPLPKPVTHGSARFRSRRELDAFRGADGLIVGLRRTARPLPATLCETRPATHHRPHPGRQGCPINAKNLLKSLHLSLFSP